MKKCFEHQKKQRQKNNLIQKSKQSKFFDLFENQDYSALFTIIHPNSNFNSHQIIRDALSQLQNNQFTLFTENDSSKRQKYSTKAFLPSQNQNDGHILQLKNIVDQQLYEQLSTNSVVIHQFFECLRLQFNQLITNVLMFNEHQNNMLLAIHGYSLFQKKVIQKAGQKVLFLNFTGSELLNEQTTVQNIVGQKTQFLYFSLIEQKRITKSRPTSQHYQPCYFQNIVQNSRLTWQQFKLIYQVQMKRMINLFNPQICILQLNMEFNEESSNLIFEDDCLEKIVRRFSKLSKNKLFVSLNINEFSADNQCTPSTEMCSNITTKFTTNLDNMKQEIIKRTINCIEQGALRQKTPKCKELPHNLYIFWLEQTIDIQRWQKQNSEIIEQYQNILSNLKISRKTTFLTSGNDQDKKKQPFSYYLSLINANNSNLLQLLLLQFQSTPIKISCETCIHFRYEENLIAIFQPSDLQLYYVEINYSSIKQQCNKFDLAKLVHKLQPQLKGFSDEGNRAVPTLAIQNKKIYLLYGFLGDNILECDTASHQIQVKQRGTLPKRDEFIRFDDRFKENISHRDGASVCYNFINKGESFGLIGGELISDIPQVCNIFEPIYFLQNNTFASGYISKEHLFRQQNIKPWPDMIILENENSSILLPGNYDNFKNQYGHVINSDHYNYAMMLTPDKKSKNGSTLSKLDIQYSDSKQKSLALINIFNGKQKNICYLKNNTWRIAVTCFEEQPFGKWDDKTNLIDEELLQNDQISVEPLLTDDEGTIGQFLYQADIRLKEKCLIVSLIRFQIGNRKQVIRESILPYETINYIK